MPDLLALVREARPHIERTTPTTEKWLDRLEEHHDELHALAERLLETDPPAASEFAAALWSFWWLRGHMEEGRELLERAAVIEGPNRQQALRGLGTIAFRQGDLESAERAFTERSELVEGERDRVDALTDLARVALRRGDYSRVREYAERAFAGAEALGEDQSLRGPLHMRAAAARMEGRLDEARTLYLESRELNERLGQGVMVAAEDHNLFYVALHSGDRDEAGRRFRSSSEWILANENA
jgi:tetratricopeptide (TPR) repeat protein